MKRLLGQFVPQGISVLDIDATRGIWNYSTAVEEHNSKYYCLDMQVGADYTPAEIYNWGDSVPHGWDCIISGQCLEHDKFFWKTLEQISERLKQGGVCIIIVPSKGHEHRYPIDCYRFYQDCGPVFAEIMGCELLHVEWNHESEWGDLAIVLQK